MWSSIRYALATDHVGGYQDLIDHLGVLARACIDMDPT